MKCTFWFHGSLKKISLLQTFFKLIQISFKIEATQSQLPLVLLQTRTTNLRGVLHDLEEGRFEISSKDAPTLGLLKSSIQVGFNRCCLLDENIDFFSRCFVLAINTLSFLSYVCTDPIICTVGTFFEIC